MILALIATAFRDIGYVYRIRVLTDGHLTWRTGFDVTMLWEFASALTPSVVGGSGIAMFIIDREGIPLGRSTAVVFVTALMDELFYVVMVPILFLIVGLDALFPQELDNIFWGLPIMTIFWIGYGVHPGHGVHGVLCHLLPSTCLQVHPAERVPPAVPSSVATDGGEGGR